MVKNSTMNEWPQNKIWSSILLHQYLLHWLLKFETIILQVRVIFVFFPYSLLEVYDNFSAFLKSTLPLLGNRNYTYLNLYSCSLISSYFLLGPHYFSVEMCSFNPFIFCRSVQGDSSDCNCLERGLLTESFYSIFRCIKNNPVL